MLAEAAVVLPAFVLLALLALSLSDLGVARLRAQEAARAAAWKPKGSARAEAERSAAPLADARVELASVSRGAAPMKGPADQDPLVSGWPSRALDTARAEVRLSVPPWPWGGPRKTVEAVHVVDRPGRGDRVGWVRRTTGAEGAPLPRTRP